MQAVQESLPVLEAQNIVPLTNLFVITEDQLAVASYVAEALQQRGAKTAILETTTLQSPEQLTNAIAQLRQLHGNIAGIVHLAPLATIPMPDNLGDWQNYTQIHAKSLFQLLQLCADDLQQQGRVLAASLLGGNFGRDQHGDAGLPSGGSHTGLLKTLAAEWQNVHAKAIDFDSSLSAAEIAEHIINELLSPGRIEVGYPQGKRTIFQTVIAPLPVTTTTSQLKLSSDWVILVTGGARGITAEIASELVLPGMKLIVVGRSPEPDAESSETAGITNIKKLRQVLLQQARVKKLSQTPMQIERQIMQVLRNRAIRRNLEYFRQAGANLEYLAVDVRNAQEFGALIDNIYARYHRLDAVIHGAGIIEDKLIVDKTLASFDRVFDTKVDSTFILSRHLRPDSLKAIVLFSSVAGRCGNRGQSDYAAANEVMNRLAWQMDKLWSNTRIVAINWGPWDTVGMASEEVKRQFKERGVIPIPLPSGRQFVADELRYGEKGDTEVIAGDGPWEADEAQRGKFQL